MHVLEIGPISVLFVLNLLYLQVQLKMATDFKVGLAEIIVGWSELCNIFGNISCCTFKE